MREGPWRDRTWLKKVQVKMISRQVIVPKAPSWPGGFISIIEANPGYAGMPRILFFVHRSLGFPNSWSHINIGTPPWHISAHWRFSSGGFPPRIDQSYSREPRIVYPIPLLFIRIGWATSQKWLLKVSELTAKGTKTLFQSSILTPFSEWCEISSVRLAKFLIIFQQTWKFETACFGRLNLSRIPGEAWWQEKVRMFHQC